MSAAALHAPPVWTPARRDDRRVVTAALAAALALHVTLLLVLPLPERPAPPPPPETGRQINLHVLELEPPPAVPPPERPPVPSERLMPVPFDVRPDDAPISEPAPLDVPLTDLHPDVPPLLEGIEPPPAPPEPAVWNEGDARLERPRLVGEKVRPEYPELARITGRGGTVHLRAVVDESGSVVSIEVVSAPTPDLGFSDAAIDAVSQWRYEPGTVNGRPVKVAMRIEVEFSVQ